MTPVLKEEAKQKSELRLLPITRNFPFFAGISLLFGLAYTFCLYENPCGITYPLFTFFACCCGIHICKKLAIPIKKESWFLLAAALLIGISTCCTADLRLHRMNNLALLLLGLVFALHQFYEEEDWNIGKYLSSMLLYLLQAVAAFPLPFEHAAGYKKESGAKGFRLLLFLLTGFAAAIPISAVLIGLLCQADVVFASMVRWLAVHLFSPAALVKITLQILFGFFALYCLVCSGCLQGISKAVPNRQRIHPAIAVTCMASISLVYLLFCLIQIFYLFLGKGTLPEGYTYASYARQGFFQLLWVAFFNLVMVLCCLKYVRPHIWLRIFLTIICVCTYVMIASASYRMALYVQQYHLTWLRILVLWFLAMLFVLMAGVSMIVWKPSFRLFPYCLLVVTVFYTGLAWARPDAIAARDYVSRLTPDTVTDLDLAWLSSDFSADAAPAAASLGLSLEELRIRSQLEYSSAGSFGWFWYISCNGEDCRQYPDGVRTYNFSIARARKLFQQ